MNSAGFITARRLTGRIAMAVLAAMLVLAVSPLGASAHSEVKSSTPALGATVQPGLTQIVVIFSEEISPDQSTAEVTTNAGPVAGAQAAVDRAERTRMTIQVPALQAGKYTVSWKAVTEDDNGITNGTITFTVSGATDSGDSGQMTTSGGGTSAGTGGDSMPATGAGSDAIPPVLALLALLAVGAGAAAWRRTA